MPIIKDSIIRVARKKAVPLAVLSRNAEYLIETQMRFVHRVKTLRCHRQPDPAHPSWHQPAKGDPPELCVFIRLWLEWWTAKLSGDAKMQSETMKQITTLAKMLNASCAGAYTMILDAVSQRQRMQEHVDKMAIASHTRPDQMTDASLEDLAGTPEVIEAAEDAAAETPEDPEPVPEDPEDEPDA